MLHWPCRKAEAIKPPFGLMSEMVSKQSCVRLVCTLALPVPGKYVLTIVRDGCEHVCHQGWQCSLFPNYCGQCCCCVDVGASG